jgi:pimeloyl-ACP methyl ester carboxylesterase
MSLVVVGDDAEATPPELAREIATGIRGASLAIIEESGHLTTLEQPNAVTKMMVQWLES